MAYAIKYQSEFDNVAENRYKMEILKKDYTGNVGDILFAGSPIKHSWQTDEPKAAIKGSSLILNAYNYEGSNEGSFSSLLNLTYFGGDSQMFFDFPDPGFTPVVGVPFTISGHSDPVANGTWTPIVVINWVPGVGGQVNVTHGLFTTDTVQSAVTVTLNDHPGFHLIDFYSEEDDMYKCRFYEEGQLKFEGFLVQDDCNEIMADFTHEITLSFNDNLGLLKDVALDMPLSRVPLLDIITECISQTGLELDTFIYANIFETSFVTTDSFLAQTIIDTQTFIKNETFDNCYDVLTEILERFNLTLFQANGTWNIIRWDELRYDINIPYFQYDSTFTLLGTGTLDADFMTGFEQDVYPETGLMRSIFRPFKFDKETFNYLQPKYLLRNFDLQTLGPLQTSYTDGPNTIYEYDFTDWDPGGFSPQPDYFIRVIRDTTTGDEIQRYVVVKGLTGDNSRSVMSTPFEVSKGDKIIFEFTYKTPAVSQVGPGSPVFAVRLYNGTTTQYADGDPGTGWKTGLGWVYVVQSGDDTMNNQQVKIDPGQIPYDGLIYVYLPQGVLSPGGTDETHITDIRITYNPYINDSVKIIGHIHKIEQDIVIKNNESVDILMDDSPRNSIIGTLYRSTFTGIIQDRTTLWYRLSNPSELLRIGNITTLEQLFWRRKPRTKLQGTFYGVLNISMLSVLKNVAFNELNFIFGSLEIDYKNNNLNCTMWEVFEDGETDSDLTADYTFTYLYDTK